MSSFCVKSSMVGLIRILWTSTGVWVEFLTGVGVQKVF